MKHRILLLDGTAARSTNSVSTAIAEFTSGWTAATATSARDTVATSPFNGDLTATASDWAFARKITGDGLGDGSTYATLVKTTANITTFGTAKMTVVSLYVRRFATSPMRNLKINIEGQTGALEHSATFQRLTSAARWTVIAEAGGAVGRVDEVNLPCNLEPVDGDDVWTRLTVAFAVGWKDSAGAVSGATTVDNFKVDVMTADNASAKIIDIWGLHVSQPTTPISSVLYNDTSTFVKQSLQPREYMKGLRANAHNGVQPVWSPGYHPLTCRADVNEVQSGTYTAWFLGTSPDAGLKLFGRCAPSCPWEVLTSTVEGDLVSSTVPVDTNAVAVIRPEMRLCITELNDSTSTLGCMLY